MILTAAVSALSVLFTAHAAPLGAYETYRVSEEPIGCSAMVEEFCDHLWAPKNLGNIDLSLGKAQTPRAIRMGRRPNEYSTAYFNWANRMIAARPKLPPDLRRPLERMHYFELLARSLRRKPNRAMSKAELHADRRLYAQVESIFSSARDEALFARMEPAHPQFFQLTQDSVPFSSWLRLNEYVDRLDAEIHVALLSDSPEWRAARATFEQIRQDYLEEIQSHPRFSAETKAQWTDRLRTVALEIPGSNPETLDSNGRSCAKTEGNAFYSPQTHAITICAGYFTGIELSRTIAHELSHALAVRRTVLLHKRASAVAEQLRALQERSCKPTEPPQSCEQWAKFKATYQQAARTLPQAEISNREYLACFRKRELKGEKPDAEFLSFVAQDRVNDLIEYAASRSWFLQLSQPKEFLRDGTVHPNPRHLNPCGFYWAQPQWDNLLNPQVISSFFVQEFRCQKGTPAERLEKSIQVAKDLSLPLMEKELLVAGPFAADRDFERKGYSEDIEEDFADSLSGEVFARALRRQSSLSAKRALTLASLAQLCDQPSVEKQFPDEAAAQKKFYFESHSEGVERRQRLLTTSVRRELKCNRDFRETIKDCD